MSFEVIVGNIFDSPAKYMVHQTNCKSRGQAAGIASIIYAKLPYADCYSNRLVEDVPGTINIRGNGDSERYVVNLMGQLAPGSNDESSDYDNASVRRNYFVQGLRALAEVKNLKSVSFPAGIGCAIAGGDWETYLSEIKEFHDNINQKQPVDVSVYCLPMNRKQFNI